MRAAILRGAAGSGDFVVGEAPVPEPGAGECLVRVLCSGVCGSDVHFVLDGTAKTSYTPIILGHEAVGRVERCGEGASIATGTRVSIVPLVTCMDCERCRGHRSVICTQRLCLGCDVEGAFAEFVVVPERNLYVVPEGLSDEVAAVATDSVATAFHAVRTRGQMAAGKSVAVWGTGGLGLSAVGVARTLGASHIFAIDPRPAARAWALASGADEALHPDDALTRIAHEGGVDLALEFVGRSQTVESAVRSLDSGGRAVVVGVGHEAASAGRLMTFVMREREIVGSYGSEPEEVGEVLDLLASGELRLPHVVGDVMPLDEVKDAMYRVQAGDTGGSRIVIRVQD